MASSKYKCRGNRGLSDRDALANALVALKNVYPLGVSEKIIRRCHAFLLPEMQLIACLLCRCRAFVLQ
eukprot:scaffold1739_cov15-Prasinocladus_malaysianus.AAC.1